MYSRQAFLSPAVLSFTPKRRVLSRNASRICAKLKVEVINIGKRSGKDAVFDDQINEYVKRMRPVLSVQGRWVKAESAVENVKRHSEQGAVILLDEKGKMAKDSVHFSEIMYDALERGGSRLAIVIGDAEGLPDELLTLAERSERSKKNVQLLSLSTLTLTHKMVGWLRKSGSGGHATT